MGHASILITQRYAHLASNVDQNAVCLLDAPSAPPSERAVLEVFPDRIGSGVHKGKEREYA
jgi:hypothetical protein